MNIKIRDTGISDLNNNYKADPYFIKLINSGWKVSNSNIYKEQIIFSLNSNLKILYETFEQQPYNFNVNLNGKSVLDIGAHLGDTPIYFTKILGAEKVYAYEPLPNIYKMALENIRLNRIEDRIELHLAAVGAKRRSVSVPNALDERESAIYSSQRAQFFPNPNNKTFISNKLETGLNVSDLEMLDFESVVNVIPQKFLLKMDCEGSEYDIILNSYENIKKFEILVFEFHPYITKIPVSKLENLLTKDFYCQRKDELISNGLVQRGIMYCKRK